MNKTLKSTASITINASTSKVWDALTNPALIKQYLFGTNVKTDWKIGSPITFSGTWEGKTYEDKGKILEIEPGKLLVHTFWSSLAGLPDVPENYKTVRYEVASAGKETKVTIIQDNNENQEEVDHTSQNWKTILEGMKKLLES